MLKLKPTDTAEREATSTIDVDRLAPARGVLRGIWIMLGFWIVVGLAVLAWFLL